jgi:DMSO/TMAO reductase YedYZ molybdopterin-dependent catalytic subunit
MASQVNRRDLLRGTLAAAGLGIVGAPSWILPAHARAALPARFVDVPEPFVTTPNETTRILDIRRIDAFLTPADQFFTVQHFGHPALDAATFRLKVTGLVDRPLELSLDRLRRMQPVDVVAGFECSGNSGRRVQGLASNGRWTGVPLDRVLREAGLRSDGREVVFFGADRGEEEVEFRGETYKVDQQFGRSMAREEALAADAMLAFALNGEPLTRHQGFPLRLIVQGWYGVANVKWLTQIHVQADRYLGNYQARWYRTLKGETIDGEMKWTETAITRMRLKSVIASVTPDGERHKVVGFVLNDGTPLRAVDVQVDGGPWEPAVLDSLNTRHSWKRFTYTWAGATPGEHTLVSRVTDANGQVQPAAADLATKKTFLEDAAQFPRRVSIG